MQPSNSAEVLSTGGAFDQQLDGFEARIEQQTLAASVEQALQDQSILVAEAGTGTGKTIAYLVPALLSGLRTIISTGTKNLQDQLFLRDLPRVQEILGVTVKTALLKGRANYLCPHRLRIWMEEINFVTDRDELLQIADWAEYTDTGDFSELSSIAEDAPILAKVTSSNDNCLGQKCPDIAKCPLLKARQKAQKADLVVVNHHLFMADLVLKDQGFGELLPAADAVIMDEAHQIPDVASRFFGEWISSRQLQDLAGDSLGAALQDAPDDGPLMETAETLSTGLALFRLAFGATGQRDQWDKFYPKPEVQQAIENTQHNLSELLRRLKEASVRSEDLDHCYQRAQQLNASFKKLTVELIEGQIHWVETHKRSVSIHLTPLSVAEPFSAAIIEYDCAWVFTSATLAVGDDFSYFSGQLGLFPENCGRPVRDLLLGSSYDYPNKMLCYLPSSMPEPSNQEFTKKFIEAALPVLEASRGRAFLLFTSHRALREAAKLLEEWTDYKLYVQGDSSKRALIDGFVEDDEALLLGTSSFWQGVDIQGDNLSSVLIDKLPFASPGDPVMQSRLNALRNQGLNPFATYQIPQAVISLKQGVGRLIRGAQDRGVLMIGDPRLKTKGYGKTFIKSLPDARYSSEISDVTQFFKSGVKKANSSKAQVGKA